MSASLGELLQSGWKYLDTGADLARAQTAETQAHIPLYQAQAAEAQARVPYYGAQTVKGQMEAEQLRIQNQIRGRALEHMPKDGASGDSGSEVPPPAPGSTSSTTPSVPSSSASTAPPPPAAQPPATPAPDVAPDGPAGGPPVAGGAGVASRFPPGSVALAQAGAPTVPSPGYQPVATPTTSGAAQLAQVGAQPGQPGGLGGGPAPGSPFMIGQTTAQPVAPGGPGAAPAPAYNPNGTSRGGTILPGVGPVPKDMAFDYWNDIANGKSGTEARAAIATRRAQRLAEIAGGAKSPADWDNRVLMAWREGLLNNDSYHQLQGHYENKDYYVNSMMTQAEQAQAALTRTTQGLVLTPRGLEPDPKAVAGGEAMSRGHVLGEGRHSTVRLPDTTSPSGYTDVEVLDANLPAFLEWQKQHGGGATVVQPQVSSATPTGAFNALIQNEGSGPNQRSTAGATGRSQIIESTFNEYKLGNEKYNNEEDRVAAARRYTDDMYRKYGGDLGRIAVGYFSGTGNVAPPGSPNPWKEDKADTNGVKTSDYVRRYLARFPNAGRTTPGPQGANVPPAVPGQTRTVVASRAPLVVGDSIASRQGVGGTGVVGAQPGAVRDALASSAQRGGLSGQHVVLSSGASNNPGDLGSVEQQLQIAQNGGARVSLLGVGPAVEAKAPGTNANLRELARRYNADFVPLPNEPGMMAADGVHPTDVGYAALRQRVGTQVAGPAGVATPGAPAPPSPAVAGDVGAIIGGMTGAGANPATLQPPDRGGATPPAQATSETPAPTQVAQIQNPYGLPTVPHYTEQQRTDLQIQQQAKGALIAHEEKLIERDLSASREAQVDSRQVGIQDQTLRELLHRLPNIEAGWGGEWRAGFANFANQLWPGKGDLFESASDRAAAIKMFTQLALQQEAQMPGVRSGIGLAVMNAHASPNINMPEKTISDLLNAQLVRNQAIKDYASAFPSEIEARRSPWAADNVNNRYRPVETDVQAAWNDPKGIHAPAVYQAATDIINGHDYEDLKKYYGTLEPAQRAEVMAIVRRVHPGFVRGANQREPAGSR